MNGKKAKMIRRLAEEISIGKEKVQYHERAMNPRRPTARTRFLYDYVSIIIKKLKRRYKSRIAHV